MGAICRDAAGPECGDRAAGERHPCAVTSANSHPPAESDHHVLASPLTPFSLEFITRNPDETAAIGEGLAVCLQDGDVLLLHGDLGAGKTTLAKGIASALGVEDVVSSPSFSLVNEYDTGPAVAVSRLYHLDLYRLQDEGDLASIGFDDLVASAG